jgi:hypothetical protein
MWSKVPRVSAILILEFFPDNFNAPDRRAAILVESLKAQG